jgi:EpsI family protein
LISRTTFHVALAGLAFALCYLGVIIGLVSTWTSSYVYSYGFAVAFISGYMVWTRSETLRTLEPVPDYLFGVPFAIAGVAMLAAGHLGALVSLQQASLLVTLAGLTLMLFGRRAFQLVWVPCLYLLMAFPIWDPLLSRLRPPSQVLSGGIAVSLLHSIGVPAVQEGTLIVLPNLILDVLAECSGVNQLMAIVAMTLPAAYLWLDGRVRRVTLVSIAVAVAYLSNGFRIAVVGYLAHRGLGDGDVRNMHLFEGLGVSVLSYLVIFGCLSLLANHNQTARPSNPGSAPVALTADAKRRRGRHLWLEAGVLMAVVLVGTLPFLFRPASVPLEDALQLLPGRIGDWTIDTVSKPVAAKFPALDNELLHAYPTGTTEHRFTAVDDDLVREYRSASGERVRLYIGYYRDQQHGKELIGDLSHALRAAASPLELVLPSETIEINQVVPGTRIQQGLIFWYDLNGRIVADIYQAKAYMVWDALTRRRTNGAVIMVGWEYPAGGDFGASRLKTIGFVRELVPLLRQHLPS